MRMHGNKMVQEDENVSKEMEDQEENFVNGKTDEKECHKEENMTKRSDEKEGQRQEDVIKGSDEKDGERHEDVMKGSDEMDDEKQENVITGSDKKDGQKQENVIKRNGEMDGQKQAEDVIKGNDEMDGQKKEDVIKESDDKDGQKEEGVIDRCAGQQHDFDRRKENANRIPNPEEVITSKRRKVRLKDIIRNCMAEVDYLHTKYKCESLMSPLLLRDHVVYKPPNWRANDALGHVKQSHQA